MGEKTIKFIVSKILIITLFALFAFYCLGLIKEFHKYTSNSSEAEAEETHFYVQELKRDDFHIECAYFYQVGQCRYKGVCLFTKPVFINRLSAEEHVRLWSSKKWKVFYNPKKPMISTLQKTFPIKVLVRTIVVFLVMVYFFGLRQYLKKIQRSY